MEENPYQSPTAAPEPLEVKNWSREELRLVAKFQKGILVCMLLYLIVIISDVAIHWPSETRHVVGLGYLGAGLAGGVLVCLLAMRVYSTGLGVFLGILTVIPCVGLIALLVVNGKATAVLKQNGIQVGLLGANLSKI